MGEYAGVCATSRQCESSLTLSASPFQTLRSSPYFMDYLGLSTGSLGMKRDAGGGRPATCDASAPGLRYLQRIYRSTRSCGRSTPTEIQRGIRGGRREGRRLVKPHILRRDAGKPIGKEHFSLACNPNRMIAEEFMRIYAGPKLLLELHCVGQCWLFESFGVVVCCFTLQRCFFILLR